MPIGEHARVNCKRRTPPGDKCLASHAPYRPGASADRLPRQPLRLEPPIRQRRDLRLRRRVVQEPVRSWRLPLLGSRVPDGQRRPLPVLERAVAHRSTRRTARGPATETATSGTRTTTASAHTRLTATALATTSSDPCTRRPIRRQCRRRRHLQTSPAASTSTASPPLAWRPRSPFLVPVSVTATP